MNKLISTAGAFVDLTRVEGTLLAELDKLVTLINKPCIITSAFRQGDKGQHGLGRAIDIMCEGISLLDFYLTSERFSFTGIGVYHDWEIDGRVVGGLHLDIRTGDPARWQGYRDTRNGSNVYIALNKNNLKQFGII